MGISPRKEVISIRVITMLVKNYSWAGSLARIGHEPPKLGVAGSNPVPPAI